MECPLSISYSFISMPDGLSSQITVRISQLMSDVTTVKRLPQETGSRVEVILVEEKNNVFADLGPCEARTHDVGVITTTVCRVSERPGQWSVCVLFSLKPFETDLLEYP